LDEASKTRRLRGPEFERKYLSGKVIDIGAGKDPVCSWAEVFDVADGDANFITRYRAPGTYDTVHSSHCLEHMFKPDEAIREWWSLVKPGGYLVVVVPHEDLYEQGIWPSIFNRDHKVTFRLGGDSSWSHVSFDIGKLVRELPGAILIGAEVQDFAYRHDLRFRGGTPKKRRSLKLLKSIARRIPVVGPRLKRWLEDIGVGWGVPLDQTSREALAQIQVIARKDA
jgi:SAM-dependent methyltransferase